MSNSTSLLDLISSSQAQKEVTANALLDAGSPATLYGRRASTTSALTWGFYGGYLNILGTLTAIANGTVALTGSATNYVESDPATGAVTSNTSAFTAGRIRLYTVVTGASSVTSYTDWRSLLLSGQRGQAYGVASLDASGKILLAELPAAISGALNYQGVWNASTNTPALASGVGTKGYYYVVSVAGTTSLDGHAVWSVNDVAVFNGTDWDVIQGGVTSGEIVTALGYTPVAPDVTTLSSLTTVGALNAGSITSGFGAIDISTDTLAAGNTTITGTLSATGASTLPTIYGSAVANGDITIEGTSHATKTTSYVLLQPTGGNVCIGTTAPKTHPTSGKISNLAVEAVNSYTTQSLMAYSNTAPAGGILVLAKSRGTSLGTLTETQANDYLGYISGEGVNSSSALAFAGYLAFAQDGAAGAAYIGGKYSLFLGTSSAAPTERFRINSLGYAGIASGARLQLDGVALTGDTYIVESSANVLDLYAGGVNTLKLSATAATITGTLSATDSVLSSGATSGIGYATGAGGTVTQATSKATGVTLNKMCGTITTHGASLGATTSVTFILTNSVIAATDLVISNLKSGGTYGAYDITIDSVGAGSARITIYNRTAGALAETLDISFSVLKSVSA